MKERQLPGAPADAPSDGWQGLLDAARDALISIDADGRVLEWNRQAEALFGWQRNEAVGSLLAEMIVPPAYRDQHLRGLQRFVATGRGDVVFQRLRLPALHRSGREFPIEFTIWPSRHVDGWHFHSFLHDISGELRQEAHLALLRRSAVSANQTDEPEQAIRAVLDTIRETTGYALGHAYLADADDLLVPTGWWSPAPREPLAAVTADHPFRPGSGLPGRVSASGLAHWIPDLATDRNFPRSAAAVESGLSSAFALPITTGDRTVAVIEVFSEEAREPDRDLLEVMQTVGTQLGRVFEREEALRELQLAVDQREAIVSIVGHELRGPLATTHGAADLLATELAGSQSETVDDLLDLLDRELGRLGRLVDDLLTAQRLDSRSLKVRTRDVPVREAIQRVVTDVGRDGILVRASSDLRVAADPDHLTQMLWNLLSNASAHGRPPISVTALPTVDNSLAITVRDDGAGVPAPLVSQLFERFSRGEQSTGTGLGLSIARGLARANDGELTYDTDGDGGPCFVLQLPSGNAAEAE